MITFLAIAFLVTGHLGGQFGGMSSGCSPTQSGLAACTNPSAQPDEHCTGTQGNVQTLTGTYTVKRPGIQVLLWVFCNARPSENGATLIYMGERYQGTSDVMVSRVPAGISANYCWAEWQECNNGQPPLPNGDFEYQLIVGGGGP